VHSHGLGGSRAGGDAWGRAWCAQGFAVVHVQHPGSDFEVLRQGGLRALLHAANARQLLDRVADMRFVLDEIERRATEPASPFARIRRDAIGASGHSFGAQTVQALAGQRYPVAAELSEPRVRAFVALSPAPLRRSRMSVQEQFGAAARPFLSVTGSLDGDPLGSSMSADMRASVYDGLPRGRRALLWLDGADHMTFAGNAEQRIDGRGPFRRSPEAAGREARHHALVAHVTATWWRACLLEEREAQAQLRSGRFDLGPDDRWRYD
jgi:predicted dienelactone hydrolase